MLSPHPTLYLREEGNSDLIAPGFTGRLPMLNPGSTSDALCSASPPVDVALGRNPAGARHVGSLVAGPVLRLISVAGV